jgi:O-antigen/teichoic acid export membrane protein
VNGLVKGSILIAAGTIYKILLTILIDKLLATQLGVNDFGQYKYGITIVLLLSTLCTMGLGSSIIRTIAIQKSLVEKKIIISISLFLVAIISLLVVFLAVTQSWIFGIDPIFFYATLFYSANTIFNSIYSGLEKPKLKVWINDVLGFTLYLAFLLFFFNFEAGTEHVAFVYLFYVLIVFFLNIISSRKFLKQFNIEYISSLEFKEYLKYTYPLFGVSILIILSANLDKLLLNYFVSEEQLGIYFAVFNISNLLPLILTILVFLYLPKMSKYLQEGKRNKATIISSYFSKWTMIMASMVFGAIIFYTEEIVRLLYSDQFIQGIIVLKILALGQWINVSLGFTGQNLLALGDSRSQLYIRLASFIIGAILLFFGAKYYGNIGASWSILIALMCSNLLQILVLRTKHKFVGYRKQNLFAFIIIILTAAILSLLHQFSFFENINFLVLIFVDLSIFLILLFITKVLSKKDLKVLNITEV